MHSETGLARLAASERRGRKRLSDSEGSGMKRSIVDKGDKVVVVVAGVGEPGVRSLPTAPEGYTGACPNYRQPAELGCFSLDAQRTFHDDGRLLRHFAPPRGGDDPRETPGAETNGGAGAATGADCRTGDPAIGGRSRGWQGPIDLDVDWSVPGAYIQMDHQRPERLDHIVSWLSRHWSRFALPGQAASLPLPSLNTDFVTWRGHLTKVLGTPYERRDGWQLAATLFRGTRYLSEVETEAARRERETRSLRQQQMCYWGYKFEQYMTADRPGGEPDVSRPVNTNEGFCSVVRTRLAGHSLVFAGEVDCRAGERPPPSSYVELKTSREVVTPGQRFTLHRFKLIKWWAQSFLIGVPRIVVGFRDDSGLVHHLQTYETLKIPKMVASEEKMWNAAVSLNFCEAFLSFLKEVVTRDDPKVVYLFSWEPGADVTYRVYENSEQTFLPDWYIEQFRDLPKPGTMGQSTAPDSPIV
uniref:decapping and exoribonuclease protein n=1 Tax=Myxine glutinosa TaxID=7769 RepID=UPI00358E16F7